MSVYSYAQLEGLWDNAGGPPAQAPVAAAVGEAESSGNASAENKTDNGGTQTSWGLWQISDGTHNMPVPNILDPAVNAQQAVTKYDASGWAPWGTYDSGAYRQFLQLGVAPDTNVEKPAGGTAATLTSSWEWWNPTTWTPANAAGSLASVASSALAPIGKSIARYVAEGVLVVAGLGLVVWGLGRTTGAGRKVESQVEQAAPAVALAAA